MVTTYADDLDTKLIGVERTARENTMHGIHRNEFETQVQDPIEQRNPMGEYLKHVITNGKEPEDLRFWAILGILGVLFFVALMGTR